MKIIPRNNNYVFNLLDDEFLDGFFKFPYYNKNDEEKVMKTDIKKIDNGHILVMDLPGIDKKDVKISIDEGYLNISVQRELSEEKEDKNYIRKERYIGNYSRSFYVGDIDEEKVDAKYKDGTLTLFIPLEEPKKEEPKKYIEIK